MAGLREEAHKLLVTDRYNKDALGLLTQCVHSQVSEGWYDVELNLAVLKLYQFNPSPEIVDMDVLVKILGLALAQTPSTDFKLCMYLVPEQYQNMDSVLALCKLNEKLEVCQFKSMWELLQSKPEVLAVVPSLEKALRKSIFDAVALTFQEIPAKVLSECLNVPTSRISQEFPGVEAKGELFILPASANNQPKAKSMNASNDIQLTQLAQVLSNTIFSN